MPPSFALSPQRAQPAVAALSRLGVPILVWLVVATYCELVLGMALFVPFPSRIDELQHLSVIRAQFEQPALFPDWSRYLVLRGDDLTAWSNTPNYINHPSLYYLLLSPLMAVTSDPLLFRLVNVLLSTGALGITIFTVQRRFAPDIAPPVLFAVLAASFPKAAVVGGMVNNDNLAAVAGAMLFAGLAGMPGQALWLMAALAIAGWTKLTAFIALAAVAGAWLGLGVLRGEIGWRDRVVRLAALGVVLGALPYLATFVRTGHLLWVNEAVWRVAPANRMHLDIPGFVEHFLTALVMKWPASEVGYAFPVALAGSLAPMLLAAIGICAGAPVVRRLALAYAFGLTFLFFTHFLFGWRSFRAMGDITIMQTRYYNILWPGIALAATVGLTRLMRRWKYAGWAALAACLSPTLLGAMILARI